MQMELAQLHQERTDVHRQRQQLDQKLFRAGVLSEEEDRRYTIRVVE